MTARVIRRSLPLTILLLIAALAGGFERSGAAPPAERVLWVQVGDRLWTVDLETGERLADRDAGDGRLVVDPAGDVDPLWNDGTRSVVLGGVSGSPELEGSVRAVVRSGDAAGWVAASDDRLEGLDAGGRLSWSVPFQGGERLLALSAGGAWTRSGSALRWLPTAPEGEGAQVVLDDLGANPAACVDPLSGDLVVAGRTAVVWISESGVVRSRAPIPSVRQLVCGRFGTVWALDAVAVRKLRGPGSLVAEVLSVPLGEGAEARALAADPRDNAVLIGFPRRIERWTAEGDLVWRREFETDAEISALAAPGARAVRTRRPAARPSMERRVPPKSEPGAGLGPDEVVLRGRLVDPAGRPVPGATFSVYGRQVERATTDAAGLFETPPMPYLAGDQLLAWGTRVSGVGEAQTYFSRSTHTGGTTVELGDRPLDYPCAVDFEDGLFPANDLNGEVRSIAVFDDGSGPALYVGGTFTTARGITVNRVARWDGTSWSALGSGLRTSSAGSVDALKVFDDGTGPKLHAGGSFTLSGAATVRYVAKWTGSAWVEVGGNLNGQVLALGVHDAGSGAQLYATGAFTTSGATTYNRIARLSGSSWTPMGSGLNGTGRALASFGGSLYVGGSFTTAGGVSASRIARWNGTSWSAVGSGVTGGTTIQVNALTPWNDGSGEVLAVGGRFTTAGGVAVNHVAKWNGSGWSSLATGLGVQVNALAAFDDGWGPTLYAAGSFTSVSGETFNRVARWWVDPIDGGFWSPLGDSTLGVNGNGLALGAGTVASVPGLFVGGAFTSADGVASSRVARLVRSASCTDWYAPEVKIVDPSPGETTGDTTPALRIAVPDRGEGADAATLVVRANGSPIAVSCTPDGEVLDCLPALPLAGAITLSATVEDLQGNLSTADSVAFTVADTDPPTIAIVEPAEGSTVATRRPAIRVQYADSGAGVDPATLAITWNGGALVAECQSGPAEAVCVPVADSPQGAASLVATVSDLQGNGSAPATRGFVVDAPAAPATTTFAGTVRFATGAPVAGASVRLSERASISTSTAADGSFTLAAVEIGDATSVDLTARFTEPGATYLGFASVAPQAGGVTPVVITLEPRCDSFYTPLALDADRSGIALVPSSLSGAPMSFATFDAGTGPEVVVAGSFNHGGGGELGRVARWTGRGWERLGLGLANPINNGVQPEVRALAVHDDGSGPALFAGGRFTLGDGKPANYLARWNGSAWSEAARGVDKRVTGLAVFDDGTGAELFVAGEFTRVGTRLDWTGQDHSIAATYVAKWNGSTWTAAGAGVVPTNVVNNPLKLSAFPTSGGARLFLWEESGYQVWERVAGAWQPVAVPPELYSLRSIAMHDDGSGTALYLAAGGIGIRKLVGSAWQSVLADDFDTKTLASFADAQGSFLYAAGNFVDLPGYTGASELRRWNGSAWSAPLTAADRVARLDGPGPAASLMLAPTAGASSSEPVWRPAEWRDGARVDWSHPTQVVGGVRSVAFAEGAGGEIVLFSGPTRVGAVQLDGRIASWDGQVVVEATAGLAAGNRVVPAFDGRVARVYGLAEASGQVAEWNGSGWTALGPPLGPGITAVDWIDVAGERRLYAAGPGLLRWNGAFWHPIPGAPSSITGIEGFGGALYTPERWKWTGTTWSQIAAPPASLAGDGKGDEPVFAAGGPEAAAGGKADLEERSSRDASSRATPATTGTVSLWEGTVPVTRALVATATRLHFRGTGYAWTGSSWIDAGVQPRLGYLKHRFLSPTVSQSGWPGTVQVLERFDDGNSEQILVGGNYAGRKDSSTTGTVFSYRNLNLGTTGVDGPPVVTLAAGRWQGAPAVAVGGGFGDAGGESAGALAIWHPSPDWQGCSTAGRPPVITVTAPVGAVTAASSVTIEGELDEPAELTVDGAPVTVAPDRTFAFPSGPLVEGENHYFLRAVDRTDLETTLSYVLLRDSTAPSLAIASPLEGGQVFTGRPRIELAFDDAVSGIDPSTLVVTIGGSPLTAGECAVRATGASCQPATSLALGPAVATARIADRAGNLSALVQRDFVVASDGEAPSTTVVGTVRFSGGAPAPGARVRVLGRAGAETTTAGDGSFALPVPSIVDDRPLRVYADLAQGTEVLAALSPELVPVPSGTTVAGVLTLGPACDLEFAPGLSGTLGVGGRVHAAAVYDDGGGAALYLGGSGLVTSGGLAHGLVRWSGGRFEAVAGSPTSGTVRALAAWNDGGGEKLYVGGSFTLAGGQAVKGLAAWNGSQWSDVGGGVTAESRPSGGSCTASAGTVYSLRVGPDGAATALYVGGRFSKVGAGLGSELVAKWTGAGWASLGARPDCWVAVPLGPPEPAAYALELYDAGGGARLHVGGNFTSIAGVPARGIARHDGAAWSELGGGIGRPVSGQLATAMVDAMTVFDSGDGPELVVAGLFTRAGLEDVVRSSIARWDGSKWSSLGEGLETVYTSVAEPTGVQALYVHDDGSGAQLYAAGKLTGDTAADFGRIARWNGTAWTSVAEGISDPGEGGMALLAWNGELVTGGGFLEAGDRRVDGVARWDGRRWRPFGDGLDGDVRALAVFDDGSGPAIYLGGDFEWAGDRRLDHVARFDGASFHPVGGGVDGPVHALEAFTDVVGPGLFVGGRFDAAGGTAAANVARWSGAVWSALGSGLSRTGSDAYLYAFETYDAGSGPELYAGGSFDSAGGAAASNLARWSNGAWSAVGAGTNASVLALARANVGGTESLFVGGSFSQAGGLGAANVARWNGAWSALGAGVQSSVRALRPWGSSLAVGGDFNQGPAYLRLWNGSTWSAPAGGAPNGAVQALERWNDGSGDALYVGTSQGVRRWSGTTWSDLGAGVESNRPVLALAAIDEPAGSALYLGGAFTTAGGEVSGRLARWGRVDSCIDLEPPTIQIVSPTGGAQIVDPTPTLVVAANDEGSGVDAGTIAWTVDGTPLATDCSAAGGEITCTPTAPLAAGAHELRASVADEQGNVGLSDPVSVTLDPEEPIVLFVTPADGAFVDTATPAIEVGFLGTIPMDLGSFSISLAGASPIPGLTCDLFPDRAECSPLSPLAEGAWTLTASISNTEAIPGQGESDFTVDRTAPTLQVVLPTDGGWTNDTTPAIVLAFSDSGSGVDASSIEIRIDGSPVAASCQTNAAGATCAPDLPLAVASHSLVVEIADFAGRVTTSAPIGFTIELDFDPPVLTVSAPLDGFVIPDATLTILGSVSEEATVTVDGAGVALAPDLSFSHGPLPLAEGHHSFLVRAVDRVGNEGVVTLDGLRDATAPALAFYAPTQGQHFEPLVEQVRLLAGGTISAAVVGSLELTANGVPIAADCEFCPPWIRCTVPESAGPTVELRATILDQAGNESAEAVVTYTTEPGIDIEAPILTIYHPTDGTVTTEPTVIVQGSVNEPSTVTVNGQPVPVDALGQFRVDAWSLVEGLNTLTLVATDPASNSAQRVVDVTRDTTVPTPVDLGLVSASVPVAGFSTVTGAAGAVAVGEAGLAVEIRNSITNRRVSTPAQGDGSFSTPIAAEGGDRLELVVVDPAGNRSALRSLLVPGTPAPPADPGATAPGVDPQGTSTICSAFAFLFEGADPVQRGTEASAIACERAAWLRGRVLDPAGTPLSGVRVAAVRQPEVGSTLTRADGWFDLVVNGGGPIVLRFRKAGHPVSERTARVAWGDSRVLEDVILTPFDTTSTVVDLPQVSGVTAARASVVSDSDGTRQATLLFPQGTTAQLELSDGSTQPISSLTVRATEYTVGPGGPRAMPAELPPTSAYTYAIELSVDEAEAAGADTVRFGAAIPFYLENFLDLPTGTVVPGGVYDRARHVWRPSRDGRVVELLSIDGGLATLDVSGSGQPATPAELTALGVTDAERTSLASLYPVGQSLWRMPIEHFSPHDFNFPPSLPEDAKPPQTAPPKSDSKRDDPCKKAGSIIECDNRVLGETLPLVGSPFALHYRSDRVPGRKAAYRLELPATGELPTPGSAEQFQFELQVGGQRLEASMQAGGTPVQAFDWDGKDAFGRALTGPQPFTARVGYTYSIDYGSTPPGCTNCFGLPEGGSVSLSPGRDKLTFWQIHTGRLGAWDAKKAVELGGWTLTPHHTYDPHTGTLYLGDGSWRRPEGVRVVTSTAGDGTWGTGGDGGPARLAQVRYPIDAELRGEVGEFYFLDYHACRLRKVGADGFISTVAGSKCPDSPLYGHLKDHSPGDGLPATAVELAWPTGFAVSPEGDIYIADPGHGLLRWIDRNGVIWSLAGRHRLAKAPPGGPNLNWFYLTHGSPRDVVVSPLGDLFVSRDVNDHFWGGDVQRIDPWNERKECVLGCGGIQNCSVDPEFNRGLGGPATEAHYVHPRKLRLTSEGHLLVVDNGGTGGPQSVLKVDLTGAVDKLVGNHDSQACAGGTTTWSGSSPDGIWAQDAYLGNVTDASEGWDGSLFVTDKGNAKIYQVGQDGRLRTVVGTGEAGFNGDSWPATSTRILEPTAAVPTPRGSLYVLDAGNRRIRQLEDVFPPLPNSPTQTILVPSEDGRTRYIFDGKGRHLRTEDAQTGQVLLTFGYDTEWRLVSITDAFGNATQIVRDGSGIPQRIVAPFGQETQLELFAPGDWLSAVVNPAGERFAMTYSTDGLLASFETPEEHVTTFTYDALGQLERDEDALEGFQQVATVEAPNDRTVTVTTAMGRVTSYRTEQLATGVQRRTVTQPDGTVDVSLQRKDGSAERTASDGTVFTSRRGPEPRFGMQSPILTEATVVTPGGRTSTTTSGRTVTFLDPNGDKKDPANVVSILDTVTINGRAISSTWTAATRTMSTVSPEGRQGSTRFDVYGRVEEASSPGVLPVGYAYDSFGRLETVTQGTRTTTYHYDAEGYVEWIRDPLGREVHFTYDDAGRVRTQRLPDLRVIGFTYDANGNLTSVTPPGRPAHGFDHDEVDRATLYDPPQVTGVSEDRTLYAYNLDHQLELVTRPDGQLVDYVYGSSTGRLDSVITPRGTYGYSYHPTSGLLTAISDPDGGTLAFGYDGSLPTSVAWTGEVAGSIELVYDDDFEVTSQTVNGVDPVLFAYDDDGLLTDAGDLTLASSATTGFLEGTTLGTATDSLTYTTYGELDVYTASAGSPVLTYDLDRDGGGRITKKTETIGGVTAVWEYRFDAAGRLDEVKKDGVVVETYGYDANSNRTSYADFWGSGSATYDEQDRLLTYGAASFTYTDNGELLTKTEGPDVTTYGYDVFGNLRTVELPTGIDIEYLVDAANRRIGRKVNGTLVQGFLWQSQLQPAAELDGAGNVVARFVYATKPNVPDYMVKGGTTYRLFTDHLGSVRLVVNTTTGAIAQRLDYDPWGRILLDTNPGFQPFGFAGGIYDRQMGLTRFGARDYDPETGRWTAKDPIGFAGGSANFYGYSLADPVNLVDVDGLQPERYSGMMREYVENPGLMQGQIQAAKYALLALGAVAGAYAIAEVGYMAYSACLANPVACTALTIGAADAATGGVTGVSGPSCMTPKVGQRVFRIFGENNRPLGASWTPINPRVMANPRSTLGLPNVNTGRFVIEGELIDTTGVTVRRALALDGNPGGELELLIPDAENQVRILNVLGVTDEF